MKHFPKFLLIVLLVGCSLTGVAQQDSSYPTQGKWRIGFVNGAAINGFTQEQPHSGLAAAYNAHLFLDRMIGKSFFLRLTTGYSGYGGQLTTFKDDTRYGAVDMFAFKNVKQSDYILHTIDTWLGFYYQLPSQQAWKCNIGLGAGVANNFGEHESYTKTGQFIEGVYGTVVGNQFTDRFEPLWYHANATAEILLPSNKINWVIQGSYVVGLTGVRKSYSYIEFPDVTGSIRTNSFQLKIGLSKNLKSKK